MLHVVHLGEFRKDISYSRQQKSFQEKCQILYLNDTRIRLAKI